MRVMGERSVPRRLLMLKMNAMGVMEEKVVTIVFVMKKLLLFANQIVPLEKKCC